jgi:membrane-bound acyltransferase YfiQ involved in biofilm formation
MYVRFYYLNYKTLVMTFKQDYIFFLALLSATILGIGWYRIEFFRNDLTPQLIFIYNGIVAIVTPFYYILIFGLCLYFALKISEMIPNVNTKGLQIIGNYSFGIYLVHAFIIYALTDGILPKIGFNMNNWLFYPVVCILVLSMSLVFVYVMNKVPYYEYIIGSVR